LRDAGADRSGWLSFVRGIFGSGTCNHCAGKGEHIAIDRIEKTTCRDITGRLRFKVAVNGDYTPQVGGTLKNFMGPTVRPMRASDVQAANRIWVWLSARSSAFPGAQGVAAHLPHSPGYSRDDVHIVDDWRYPNP
jgi:hypothetical protein